MSSTHSTPSEPEYAWELATLYPVQGSWSESEYLDLTDYANRRIELINGRLEFLTLPTEVHECLLQYLLFSLVRFVSPLKLGKVYSSGIRVRVRDGKVRLPDIVFLHKDHYDVRHNRVWDGADLVMEVVSDDPKDRQRDYEQKLLDYAEAGIAEYWIVDYQERTVLVYSLEGDRYIVFGKFQNGETAVSKLLPEYSLDVSDLFATADDIPK